MKIVIIVLLVALAHAGQILPLSGLATAPVSPAYTLTATYPVASPGVVLTAFSGISAYAMATTPPTVGAVTLTFTYNNVNQTVFVSATYGTGINANSITFTGQSSSTTNGVTTTVYTNTGTSQGLRFDTAATYGVVVSAESSVGYSYSSLALPAGATGTSCVVTGAYTEPVLATFNMITPNGCTTTGCTSPPNATATVTPAVANNWVLIALFRATGTTQAGVFLTSVLCDANSFCNFDSIFASAWSGSFGGFTSLGYVPASSLTAGNTLVPQTGSATGSAIISDSRNNFATYTNEATFGSKQGPIVFPVGSTDVVSPTCTSAIFTPASGTTIDIAVTTDLAIVCADAGAGLFRKGAFATATPSGASSGIPSTTFAYNQAGSATSVTTSFPAYVSGSLQIVGVWAVDNALNSVLYGSCGDYPGLSTIGCSGGSGSGSSSASSVSLSLFALFSLIVMALFA